MLTDSPGITDKVKLQLAESISFFDTQMKNPDVSLEILKRDKTPSSATQSHILVWIVKSKQSEHKANPCHIKTYVELSWVEIAWECFQHCMLSTDRPVLGSPLQTRR